MNKFTGILLGCFLVLSSLATEAAPYTTATYYGLDATDSPVVAMNQAGTVIWRKTYAPYGKASNKDQDNRIGYTGHAEDQNGLVDAGARTYDPALGIFTSDDPVRFDENNPASFNRYAYANNNPYKFVDPDGGTPETVWDVANVAMGVASFTANAAAGNYGGAAVDAVGVAIDTAAAITPIVPGGAGAAIKAARGADKLADAARGVGEGKTVLGHYPEYKELGENLRARRFNVPEAAWNKMSETERWAANQKFLDRAISRGDEIILATPLDKVRPESYFARELEYMASKGYKPSADNTRLIK